MFSKLMTRQPKHSDSKTVAAVSAEPSCLYIDQRFEELSKQIKQLQKQNQQSTVSNANMAAYEQPQYVGTPHFTQTRHWQGQPNHLVEQLQHQITCLENELRHKNQPVNLYHSMEHNGLKCTYCSRMGHSW